MYLSNSSLNWKRKIKKPGNFVGDYSRYAISLPHKKREILWEDPEKKRFNP